MINVVLNDKECRLEASVCLWSCHGCYSLWRSPSIPRTLAAIHALQLRDVNIPLSCLWRTALGGRWRGQRLDQGRPLRSQHLGTEAFSRWWLLKPSADQPLNTLISFSRAFTRAANTCWFKTRAANTAHTERPCALSIYSV